MTSLDFSKLQNAVAQQWDRMNKHGLFVTEVAGDAMWECYLSSFPAGTNLMFRKRTEHDCSCCRRFIRDAGNVVAIIDGEVVSIWDVTVGEPAYDVVVRQMAALAKSTKIVNPFLHREHSIGTERNFEQGEGGATLTWNHFHIALPKGRNQGPDYFCPGPAIATRLSESRARHQVMLRGLTELTIDAFDTVLELIAQNSLYRGQEHQRAVKEFRDLKAAFDKLASDADREIFVWSRMDTVSPAVAAIRNTAIGTLLIDLSAGIELEDAVRKFESVMAPQNYKRPTALVTQRMVDDARQKVEELGLTAALERRFACLTDITINNLLFANRTTKRRLTGDAFDRIATKGAQPKSFAKVETVPVETFIRDIVPKAETVEVMLEYKHRGNMVSLIAPVHASAKPLFKWANSFSWNYQGDVADSIKERVKKAGGNVSGDLCCRLGWHNYDDLDLHMVEPGGYEIYFANRDRTSPLGGRLDVDANGGAPQTRGPVENIFYQARRTMRPGDYVLFVEQYQSRETDDLGFEVEIDWLGEVRHFTYAKALRGKEKVVVARMRYSAAGLEIVDALPSTHPSRTVWGLKTNEFHTVNALMLSPNFWDGDGIGNKHYFFMLDGCKNDGQARGFLNEFLRPDLDKHRKVLEIVGSKMKTQESENQMSGLGFSVTKHDEIVVRVTGSVTRVLKVAI